MVNALPVELEDGVADLDAVAVGLPYMSIDGTETSASQPVSG